MPARGEKVDSINYYNRELSIMNERVARMQHEKIELAQKGNDSVRASQWISHQIDRVSAAAESTLVGVFEEMCNLILNPSYYILTTYVHYLQSDHPKTMALLLALPRLQREESHCFCLSLIVWA